MALRFTGVTGLLVGLQFMGKQDFGHNPVSLFTCADRAGDAVDWINEGGLDIGDVQPHHPSAARSESLGQHSAARATGVVQLAVGVGGHAIVTRARKDHEDDDLNNGSAKKEAGRLHQAAFAQKSANVARSDPVAADLAKGATGVQNSVTDFEKGAKNASSSAGSVEAAFHKYDNKINDLSNTLERVDRARENWTKSVFDQFQKSEKWRVAPLLTGPDEKPFSGKYMKVQPKKLQDFETWATGKKGKAQAQAALTEVLSQKDSAEALG